MGLDIDFECENHFQDRPRPKLVRPPFRSRSKVEERDIKGEPTGRYFHLKRSDASFRETNLCNPTSPRRKSMPSRPDRLKVDDSTILKRGSVYQSSSEVRRMTKQKEGQRKESTYSDEAFLSFDIVDSSSRICRNDVFLLSEQRPPLVSSKAGTKSPSVDSTHSMPKKSMEFLDLSFRDLPEKHLNLSSSSSNQALAKNTTAESLLKTCLPSKDTGLPCAKESSNLVDKGCIQPKSNCSPVPGPEIDRKTLYGRDATHALPKSFSTKFGILNSPFQSEKEILKSSPRIRFSPLKKMFDPIMKSKSLRNPSIMEAEKVGSTGTDSPSISRNGSFSKSLLNDFTKTAQETEYDRCLIISDEVSSTRSSPTHLHAILNLELKHGAPSFEFSVKDPDDVLSAKTWRTDSPFNWAFTFHSSKRKSYSTGRGAKDRHGQSPPMVGQMQVSSFLCSEMSENGSLDSYMVTEFILYDIIQARRSICIEERSDCSPYSVQPHAVTVSESLGTESSLATNSFTETDKHNHHVRQTFSDCDSDPSISYPWSPADLHPYLELAAIVIQVPFKNEISKDTQIEDTGFKKDLNLSSVSTTNNGSDANSNCLNPAVVKVVIPRGTHGLPNTEEGRPSPLLDRWRVSGGCDCGGWDMACPILVFDNPCASLIEYSVTGSQQPMLLFFQGRKDKIPALCITSDGKGQYSVDFHAQLSSLQAFSICIAMLHSSEASPAVGLEKDKHRLYSNSLKLLLEEEVNHLIEAVAEEKRKATKKVEQIPPSFFLNPPFSPMGRS